MELNARVLDSVKPINENILEQEIRFCAEPKCVAVP
jgi:hypothetical protein